MAQPWHHSQFMSTIPIEHSAAEPEALALVPVPGLTREATGFDARTLARISRMAFAHPWRMGIAIAATIVAAVAQLVMPALIGQAVDSAQGLLSGAVTGTSGTEAARAALFSCAWMLMLTSVVRGLTTMLQNYQGEAVGHLIGYEMRLKFYAKLQRLSFSYHDRIHTGELMTRGMLDIEGTRMWVHTGILRSVLLVILLGGGAIMLVSIDWPLALVALGFVPFVGDRGVHRTLEASPPVVRAAGGVGHFDPRHGGESRWHPGGARFCFTGFRAGALRRHFGACAGHHASAHCDLR